MASEFKIIVRENDVWLTFKSSTGRSCSLSVAALADKKPGIVGMVLREWAADQIEIVPPHFKDRLRDEAYVQSFAA